MKILFIRHGESYGNLTRCFYDSPEVELTEKGKEQAAMSGRSLRLYLDDDTEYAVYCSPWTRAVQTCKIALNEAGIEHWVVFLDERLKERSFAGLDGRPINFDGTDSHLENAISSEEYAEIWTYDSPKSKEFGVETLPELQERVRSFLAEMLDKHRDETIIVFSHGGLGRMLQGFCDNWPEGGRFHEFKFFENGEVAVLHFN
ncbi:histidine phosphatase family protein [Candidatus Saccharibacteria bacterium]|nr:histidine phosphatase family protein [Candidatus Saccharibacteria bacterium]